MNKLNQKLFEQFPDEVNTDYPIIAIGISADSKMDADTIGVAVYSTTASDAHTLLMLQTALQSVIGEIEITEQKEELH